MSFFSVPGWSVPATPIKEQSTQVSKKRKRPASESRNVESAAINIEKIMSKLTNSLPEETRKGKEIATKLHDKPAAKKQKRKQSQTSADHHEKQKADVPASKTKPAPKKPKKAIHDEQPASRPSAKQSKKAKAKGPVDSSTSEPITTPTKQKVPSDTGLTTLQKTMRDKLGGARFRFVYKRFH